jgi:capsular exopolysaccharide synthesis family protein
MQAGPTAPPPGAPAAEAPPEEDTFVNIKHYAFLVYGRKWWVLLVTLLVAGAAGFWAYKREKVYEARAEVILTENLGAAETLFRTRVPYYGPDSLARMADSREVARLANSELIVVLRDKLKKLDTAGVKLKSEQRAKLNEVIAEAQNREDKEAADSGSVQFESIGQVQVGKYGVTVTARHKHEKPEMPPGIITRTKAEAKARALMSAFTKSFSGKSRIEMLEGLLKANDVKLKKASAAERDKLNEVRKNNPDAVLSRGVVSRLDFINVQKRALMVAEVALEEARQKLKEVRKGWEEPETRQLTVNPALQTRLLNLNTQLAQMEERYEESHPKLKRKKAEIDALKKFIRQQPPTEEVVYSPGQAGLRAEEYRVKVEIAGLDARRKALEGSIARATEKLGEEKDSKGMIEYEAKVRERRALEDMSADLRRKLREAELTAKAQKDQEGKTGTGLVRLGKVTGGGEPIGANIYQTIGFAAVLGLVMGVLLALLLEHLDDTVRNELSARRATNLPVIAKLPRFEGSAEKRFISPTSPRSDVAETFKFFHNHVRYAGPNAPEKCLQITSPGPEEGKSYVAVNLALSFASEGNRVCFVDADLRRSRTHERLDVLRPRGGVDQGLCGYLENSLAFEDVVLESDVENLSLILAGGRATNPPRLLRTERMRQLLERLKAEFDVVIIDAPPVLPVVDSAIISSMARATLLVVRFASTHQGDLAESASRLAHVNAPLVGVVINGVHGAGAGYYYGRYRYRYRYRYGSGYGYGGY